MSFDWKSFATGFLQKTQETIEEREEEAKTFEREQRQAAERNAQTISRRRAIVDRVTGHTNYLRSNGVTDEQLQAVISSGPDEIATLSARVQAAVEANNGRPLGASDIAAIINVPEGFSPLEMSMDEFIRQTYGLGTPSTEQPEEELSFLQRVLGRGEMGAARERLSRTNVAEGMTILQINEAARRAEYESLMPGTFATIAGNVNVYNPIDDGGDFTNNSLQLMARVEDSRAWAAAEGDPNKQLALLQQSLNSSIRGYANAFGASFLEDQETFIRNNLGDEYTDALLAEYGLGETEPEGTTVETDVETDVDAPIVLTVTQDDTVTESTEEEQLVSDTDADEEGQETPDVAPSRTSSQVRAETRGEAQEYGEFDRPEGSAGRRQREQQAAIARRMVEEGVDPLSIALLNSHGSDMVQYLEEQGAKSEEEMLLALTRWGQENSIVMPFDKTVLIDAIMPVVNR